MELTLRPIGPDDMDFLHRVYRSTREEELKLVDWTEAQKAAFVAHQFHAQHEHYQTHYTGATWDVILADGEPAGRLYVARWAEEIRIVDIALLPGFRNRGIGARLFRDLGEMSGVESVTLIQTEMPAHTHTVRGTIDPADNSVPGPLLSLGLSTGAFIYTNTPPNQQFAFQALPPAGGSLPHNNMQPYLTLSFCIALQGIFPQRP